MIDFETLMFMFAFLPVTIIVGVFLLWAGLKALTLICNIILFITNRGSNESRDQKTPKETIS
jgi:hypothetical protein